MGENSFRFICELPDLHVGEGVSGLDGSTVWFISLRWTCANSLRNVGEGVSDLYVAYSVEKCLLVIR